MLNKRLDTTEASLQEKGDLQESASKVITGLQNTSDVLSTKLTDLEKYCGGLPDTVAELKKGAEETTTQLSKTAGELIACQSSLDDLSAKLASAEDRSAAVASQVTSLQVFVAGRV